MLSYFLSFFGYFLKEPPITTQKCHDVILEIPSHVWECPKYRLMPAQPPFNVQNWIGSGQVSKKISGSRLGSGTHWALAVSTAVITNDTQVFQCGVIPMQQPVLAVTVYSKRTWYPQRAKLLVAKTWYLSILMWSHLFSNPRSSAVPQLCRSPPGFLNSSFLPQNHQGAPASAPTHHGAPKPSPPSKSSPSPPT